MPQCAFLSIANTEGWFIDDDLVHPPLKNLGWEVENIPWNSVVNWNEFDLVVIRSPWDYQDHVDHFLKVLQAIEASRAILLNSLELVNWNINKNYLFELKEKGIELVPTLKYTGILPSQIRDAFQVFEADQLIIKPMMGANADDTFRLDKSGEIDFRKLQTLFQDRACMLQPFMHSVVEEGEFSLMYFNGQLSHTILKTVGSGDFRVQEEHGGGVVPISSPESALLAAAEKAMKALPEVPFYARVDMVRTTRNSFALMELELIEPALYFRFGQGSATNFAECLNEIWKYGKK